MSKKNSKKNKSMKRMMREMRAYGGNGAGAPGGGLSSLLPSKRSEQFLLGLALGGAAAYILSDAELRGKIMKSGMKLYTSLVGGLEEMKEQMADLKAELAAEQDGTA